MVKPEFPSVGQPPSTLEGDPSTPLLKALRNVHFGEVLSADVFGRRQATSREIEGIIKKA